MKIAVLDADTLGADLDLSPITCLGETAVYPSTSPEEVAARLADADAVVVNKIRLNETNLKNARRLRLICVAATGYDNVDLAACRQRGIALCNVPGYSTQSVVQVTLAMALSLCTHLKEYREFVDSGAYSRSGVANGLKPVFCEIAGSTWGVVGGGGIGRGVAKAAKALGAHVVMCRREKEEEFCQMDMDRLCEEAHILSLHVPLSDATRGMLSARRIARMKRGAIVINTARGAVADEAALAQALKEGRLGGLGVDVYSQEPLAVTHPFFPLLGRPDLCLTPHMAWGSRESRNRCLGILAQNLRRFFEGSPQNRIV